MTDPNAPANPATLSVALLRRDELADHHALIVEIHNDLAAILDALDQHDRILAVGILLGVIDHVRDHVDPTLPSTTDEALEQALSTTRRQAAA